MNTYCFNVLFISIGNTLHCSALLSMLNNVCCVYYGTIYPFFNYAWCKNLLCHMISCCFTISEMVSLFAVVLLTIVQ